MVFKATFLILKVLLFSRLFGPGKLSSLPQIWRGVKKRRRRKRSGSTSSDTPPQIELQEIQYASDDEEKFLKYELYIYIIFIDHRLF